jgi:hypothetical protein
MVSTVRGKGGHGEFFEGKRGRFSELCEGKRGRVVSFF